LLLCFAFFFYLLVDERTLLSPTRNHVMRDLCFHIISSWQFNIIMRSTIICSSFETSILVGLDLNFSSLFLCSLSSLLTAPKVFSPHDLSSSPRWHNLSHYYRNINGGRRNRLMEVGIATSSNQRSPLIEELQRRFLCPTRLID
jgi:hypothetical protein